MEKLSFFTIACILLLAASACQTDKLVFDEAQQQAEDFLHRRGEVGMNFYASEARTPGYWPTYIDAAMQLHLTHRGQDWHDRVAVLDQYLDSLLASQHNDPDLALRVDLQVITYMNFHRGIFDAPSGTDKYGASARNLERMLQYSNPIHWNVLAEALILASPALEPDRYREIQEYILTGAKRTLRDPGFYKLEGEEVLALQSSADEALLLLTDSR
jgi:hypothetical protein